VAATTVVTTTTVVGAGVTGTLVVVRAPLTLLVVRALLVLRALVVLPAPLLRAPLTLLVLCALVVLLAPLALLVLLALVGASSSTALGGGRLRSRLVRPPSADGVARVGARNSAHLTRRAHIRG
jgi:hypothetical protein